MYPVPLKTINVCIRAYRQILVSFLFSSFRLTLSPLFCFITVIWTMCVSLLCYEDAVGDPYADRIHVCNLDLQQH